MAPSGHRDLYIMLVSVHGLIRGESLELGRDADTGGQTRYVVELARALAARPDVRKVDLVTRRVIDRRLEGDYTRDVELLGDKARIVRVPAGPSKYLPKESLWPYLDGMVDQVLDRLRREGQVPDIVHGHYADAGYVAARLAGLLDLPMAFTGHSLGRVKRERLLDGGASYEQLERRYKLTTRIDAEETALDTATFVVASTRQEVEEQYEKYDQYDPKRMHVIPPGVDLTRFSPPRRGEIQPEVEAEIRRFLHHPEKPIVLALSRPDPRKNIPRLIHAFGQHEALREKANLVLVAGNRDRIDELDRGAKETWWKLLELIDQYDLYGSVAYPKRHSPDQVPDYYRTAAKRFGVFVNAALTEPFGLTLLEAAATGLPVVATNDGGPRDILTNCQHGTLVDPLDVAGLGEALLDAIGSRTRWRTRSKAAVRGVERHYAWRAHAERYLKVVKSVRRPTTKKSRPGGRLLTAKRLVISDIDNTLVGRKEPLRKLIERLRKAGPEVAFGVATGRSLALTRKVLEENSVPPPDFLITSVGTAIHYGSGLVEDRSWQTHINHAWKREALTEVTSSFDALRLQPPEGQDDFKISFDVSDKKEFEIADLQSALRQHKLKARLIYSHGAYLDILPIRASKGLSVRFLAMRLGIPLDMVLVAGDSGNDIEMLTGDTLGVVVGNHDKELEPLRGLPRIYFAKGTYAKGILEGLDHYGFLS